MGSQRVGHNWVTNTYTHMISCSVVSDSLWPHALYSLLGSSVHGDSPDKNIGVGCYALPQGIFLTQGLNPGLLHYRQILYGQPNNSTHNIILLFLTNSRSDSTSVCLLVPDSWFLCYLWPSSYTWVKGSQIVYRNKREKQPLESRSWLDHPDLDVAMICLAPKPWYSLLNIHKTTVNMINQDKNKTTLQSCLNTEKNTNIVQTKQKTKSLFYLE